MYSKRLRGHQQQRYSADSRVTTDREPRDPLPFGQSRERVRHRSCHGLRCHPERHRSHRGSIVEARALPYCGWVMFSACLLAATTIRCSLFSKTSQVRQGPGSSNLNTSRRCPTLVGRSPCSPSSRVRRFAHGLRSPRPQSRWRASPRPRSQTRSDVQLLIFRNPSRTRSSRSTRSTAANLRFVRDSYPMP